MKNIITALMLAVLASVGMTGCVTIQNPDGTTSQEVDHDRVKAYVKTGTRIATVAVLEEAVSDDDRLDKAKIINNVALIVEKLSGGGVPTPEEVHKTISSFTPNKAHWANMAASIKDIYEYAYKRHIKGDAKIAAEYIELVAQVIKETTQEYVQE